MAGPKIAIYIPRQHARATNYKNDNYHVRQNAGMAVVKDLLTREGYEIDYTDASGVNRFSHILVSITSECDWWPFIRERRNWPAGDYRVIVGGFGVLNIRPFLPYADVFVFGRAEGPLQRYFAGEDPGDSIVEGKDFKPDRVYRIHQAEEPYQHTIRLANGQEYTEGLIGCPNRCLFCSYTWHRRHLGGDYQAVDLWSGADANHTMADLAKNPERFKWSAVRTTAIDGLSQRLRKMVHKPVTREILKEALHNIATIQRSPEKGRRMIFYNIVGLPTETREDWHEFMEDLRAADERAPESQRKAGIVIHSTPFQAKPATPMACAPMSKTEYRGKLAAELGKGLAGYRIFDGRAFFVTDSQTVEGLPLHTETVINLRATEEHTDAIEKIARAQGYDRAPSKKKQATLEKYLPLDKFFSEYTPEELPTRYLRSYSEIEYRTGYGHGN